MVATDIQEDKVRSLAESIGAIGLRHDVTDETQWQDAARLVGETHGRLDILVNNAGYTLQKPFWDCSLEEFRRHFRVNAESCFLGGKYLYELLLRGAKRSGRHASIVHIASTAGYSGPPMQMAYNASKAAVISINKSMASEFAKTGKKIRSNAVVVGGVETVKMMTWAIKFLCDYPHLQDRLRAEPEKINDFVEETLRMEAPTKQSPRTAQVTTTIGGQKVPAGTMVMLAHCAANRDPRIFELPDRFDIDRPNVRDHLSFARGPHACPGAPLARMEGRVTIERFLARMTNIRLSEAGHGPAEARRFDRQPTYILNGLLRLHITFDRRSAA